MKEPRLFSESKTTPKSTTPSTLPTTQGPTHLAKASSASSDGFKSALDKAGLEKQLDVIRRLLNQE